MIPKDDGFKAAFSYNICSQEEEKAAKSLKGFSELEQYQEDRKRIREKNVRKKDILEPQ